MKVFVTGGSGFVGRNLIPHLLEHGDTVVALSRSEEADQMIKDAAQGNVSIVRGSLTDTNALAEGMAGCEVVIHSAAKVDGWGPWEPFQETNVHGTKNVVKAAQQAKVPRLVHIGTEAVLLHDVKPVHLADESVPMVLPTFHAPYTSSKILAERAVLDANKPDAGFSTVVVRPRFVWGKGDTVNLPEILEAVDSGSWRGFSPRFKTSTCHVRNLVEGARLAAVKGRPGQAYFLTDGEYPDMEEFLVRMMETQGRTNPNLTRIPYKLAWALATILESVPLLGYGVTREPIINRQMLGLMARELTLVDHKARRELGYQSHMTIEQGLQEMWRAHASEDKAAGGQ
jgi:nucleoside-diphosphate-sugar epimerase